MSQKKIQTPQQHFARMGKVNATTKEDRRHSKYRKHIHTHKQSKHEEGIANTGATHKTMRGKNKQSVQKTW